MNIGILKENPSIERRVALTPAGVQSLVSAGHSVYIEQDAGDASHFANEKYEKVGATIVYTSDEIFGRSDIILKISPPNETDCQRFEDEQTLLSFLHLPIAKPKTLELLQQKKINAIGYELIEDENGDLPILQIMSEIAGQMSIQIAARFLESTNYGRGIVLGGITGIPPATVVILGAGTVGTAATRIALGVGAEVIVLDKELSRLRVLESRFNHRAVTALMNEYNLQKALQFADVVIGAVLIKGERAPHLVTSQMVQQMKPGSIILDISIDQGGCVATSRPTTLENPIYVHHNVIHYCVPNIPANVARTATYGLTNAMLPYLLEMTSKGLHKAVAENKGLARGVCTFQGKCTSESIAKRFELESYDVQELVK
ncbi:MAG: alanine dehydrogenase [Ignavibacteriales bacterium]|nr:alanine dehydrogenase [Ignavibacteriales bacterium]